MLIDIKELVKKYDLKIKGVIQVGSHHAEEFEALHSLGIQNFVLIEPSQKAHDILVEKFESLWHNGLKGVGTEVRICQVALADFEGKRFMFTETANKGQSNSLLAPKKHLEQYPDIVFNGIEKVEVTTMDILAKCDFGIGDIFQYGTKEDPKECNLLMMDVQGAELMVLRGATETLKQIDYIYTEVNRDEVYENCAKVEELDIFLSGHGFVRTDTDWAGGTWGDALYLKRKSGSIPDKAHEHWKFGSSSTIFPFANIDAAIARRLKLNNPDTVIVPPQFQEPHPFPYPEDNDMIFEEWFAKTTVPEEGNKGRVFLPVFWTAYYVRHDYGKDQDAINRLQYFLDGLPRHLKYYTIVQYDDGILNDLRHLDIKVFSMSGKPMDYPLPLICPLHKYRFGDDDERIYLANFIGRLTHPIRRIMVSSILLKAQNGTLEQPFYLSVDPVDMESYCELLSRSTFTLCPRGYGPSSFRILEALQYGSVPVYISDFYVLPHDLHFDYGVMINETQIAKIDEILCSFTGEQIKAMQERGKFMLENYFTYDANKTIILQNVGS